MPGDTLLLGFAAAAIVVLLIPGPSVLYMVDAVSDRGSVPALCPSSACRWAPSCTSAATAGLSAILLTSATAFGFVKTLGAGYLIYLGVRAILARYETTDVGAPSPRSLRRLFIDGVVVSVFNPKIAVFFLAFLPQFVDPSQCPVPS